MDNRRPGRCRGGAGKSWQWAPRPAILTALRAASEADDPRGVWSRQPVVVSLPGEARGHLRSVAEQGKSPGPLTAHPGPHCPTLLFSHSVGAGQQSRQGGRNKAENCEITDGGTPGFSPHTWRRAGTISLPRNGTADSQVSLAKRANCPAPHGPPVRGPAQLPQDGARDAGLTGGAPGPRSLSVSPPCLLEVTSGQPLLPTCPVASKPSGPHTQFLD